MIQEHIKKPLAEELLFGKLVKGGSVKVTLKDGKLDFDIVEARRRRCRSQTRMAVATSIARKSRRSKQENFTAETQRAQSLETLRPLRLRGEYCLPDTNSFMRS